MMLVSLGHVNVLGALGDTDVFGGSNDVSVDVGVLGALTNAVVLGYI